MKLNLGCGYQQIAGFTGVDFDESLSPDVVASVESLPFEDGSIEEIYASHVLEHVAMDSPALSEWYRVLQPGGLITVAVPDIVQTYFLWKHGSTWGEYNQLIDESYINATAFGANIIADKIPEMKRIFGGPGHEHKQIFLFDMLVNRLIGAGFYEVHEVVSCSVRRSALGETMAQGRKPRDSTCYTDKPYCLTKR
jgi:SAM-dependent methyltransferase